MNCKYEQCHYTSEFIIFKFSANAQLFQKTQLTVVFHFLVEFRSYFVEIVVNNFLIFIIDQFGKSI